MVDHMFPFFNVVPDLKKRLLRLKWRSIERIPNISLPLLLLSSDKDEIVPNGHMHALQKAATGAKFVDFHTFEEATHNDIWLKGGVKYWQAKKGFIERVTAITREAPACAHAPVSIVKSELAGMQISVLKKLASRT